MSGDFSENGPPESAQGPSPATPARPRLPPPGFPPGSRKTTAHLDAAEADDMSSAFISPDDPIPDRTGEVPREAFLSPDEPMRRETPGTAPAETETDEFDEGVVTGMGDDAHMALEELTLGFDPHVLGLVDQVVRLAEALKHKGEAGLRSTPGMSRFEATLRAYCVGYLAGRRAEDEES